MAGTNRTGRVSAIDYKAGTYEVTYSCAALIRMPR